MLLIFSIILNFIIYIFLIAITILVWNLGGKQKLNNCSNSKPINIELNYFFDKIKKQTYTRKQILDDLNYFIERIPIDELMECFLDNDILILKLDNMKEQKYYLFKDKEFKFLLLGFSQFGTSAKQLSIKTANFLFNELNFSVQEINSFKDYLDNYLAETNGDFIIKFSTGDNYINPYILSSKRLQVEYEENKKRFKGLENRIEEQTNKIIENEMKNTEKNFLSIIGAFIGVFTLVSINATFLKESSDLINPLLKLITINIITTLGIALLIFLVSPKIENKFKIFFIGLYILIMGIIFSIFYSNKNENKESKPVKINITSKIN
ncbi:MAG: hypothetical protein ACRC4T_20595 [Cetobacterium sp.]